MVAVVGYDEALAVYRDDEHFSAVNAASGPFGLPFEIGGDRDITSQIEAYRSTVPYGALLVTQDPPAHAKSRALLMGMITPKRLKENEEFMWQLSDRQIDEFIDRGSFDAVADYAQPYATLVIADLLGVPEADRGEFRKLLGPIPGAMERTQEATHNPLEQIGIYFYGYIDRPVKSDYRLARRPVKIGGLDVAPGTTVMLLLGAINRDPRRFEQPNEFQLERKNVREHLAFGRGIHACVGAPLARAEAKVSLERLFDRTSEIRIDESKHGRAGARRFEYEPGFIMRGLRDLHLELTPAR